jgi:hypothetical protein
VLPGATVTLKAEGSTWTQTTTANSQGEAAFAAVPIGHYMLTATLSGFKNEQQDIEVTANAIVPVRMKLTIAGLAESVEVSAEAETVNPESSRTETLTHRLDIERQPDADRSGSLAMITNNVPGTYVMHDHLHARGGHGVTFEIDGVPVPNSNLARSVRSSIRRTLTIWSPNGEGWRPTTEIAPTACSMWFRAADSRDTSSAM